MREAPVRIGSHEIVVELAAGGMATTYLARKREDTFFERLVVIKRIHPWLLEDPKSGDMLREEARLGAAVQHPHVVHVEDVTTNDHEVCLVMPYIESLSLGALLKAVRNAGERLPPAMASRIMLDVLSGLHAAHDAKDLRGEPLEIVHRDVSPNNVLVGTDGSSRIIDFGIARAASRLCQTNSGDVRGTIAYMSPEQLRRRELDRRADVFAAGAVFYEALTGQRLFEGRDEVDILIGVLADELPPVSAVLPNVGADLDAVLSRALCRDRDERFSSARAFSDALEATLAPAPGADVAALVARFGEGEFSRRRRAIRAFLEGQAVESPHSTKSRVSNTGVETHPGKSEYVKQNRRRSAAIIMFAFGGVMTISALFWFTQNSARESFARAAHPPASDSPSAVVDSAEIRATVATAPADSKHPADSWATPNFVVVTSANSSARPPSTSERHRTPMRQKVDKRRPTELQENPYR